MPILEPWTPDLAQRWWQAHAVVASPAARPSDATMPTRTWLAHDQATRSSGPRE